MKGVPIAYTYEADVHCSSCAHDRFGTCDAHNLIACDVTDNEGNEPGVIFSWDEWYDLTSSDEGIQYLACGSCGYILDEYEGVTE